MLVTLGAIQRPHKMEAYPPLELGRRRARETSGARTVDLAPRKTERHRAATTTPTGEERWREQRSRVAALLHCGHARRHPCMNAFNSGVAMVVSR